jgi:hypothetical protein
MVLSSGHYDSFVVRVFSRGPGGELLHGEVTHVATRRTQRFTDLNRVLAFMVEAISQTTVEPDTIEHD